MKPASKAKPETMDDEELISILRSEEVDATSYYTSELAKDQAEAMDRYYAAPYGNEVDGRSKITTHDIEDTVNWMMPDLMRVFMSSDDLVSCMPAAARDEAHTDQAAKYLEHILFEDNPGVQIIHDLAFDGLVQRLGVVSVMWADPQPKPAEKLEGVGLEQLAKITADPEYKIIEQAEDQQVVDGQPVSVYDLKVQRTPLVGRVVIENVPPEEIAISRRARAFPSRKRATTETAAYVRRKQTKYLADVVQMFPDSKEDLLEKPEDAAAKTEDMDTDPRVLSRFQNESVSIGAESSNHELRRRVDLLTEYLWIDYDQDDVVELRRIVRVGNIILENLAVDDCEYKAWSPIRVAHKAIGRSIADTVIDMQKIRTTMMRLLMDGLSQSLVPRYYVNTSAIDESGIDDLLDAEIGGVVRGKGAAGDAISPLVPPDVSAPALQALEYVDQKEEQQSGVTRHSQGIAPDAITKTASGIDMLQAAAGERIELVARWLGSALEDILSRALQLIVAHQDRPRWVKIAGEAMDVDPRSWSDEMAIKVHVGAGGANRQTRIVNLGTIAMKQEQAIQLGGPQNPVCNVTHLINTYSAMTQEMGFRDATRFWNNPQQAEQMLQQMAEAPPQPDPKMLEVQAKAQAAQAELQQKGQIAAQQMQLDAAQTQAELQAKSQAEQMKAQADAEAAERKGRNDLIFSQMKLEAETQIARERMVAEMALAREKMLAELALAREEMQQNAALSAWEAEHRVKTANDVAASKAANKKPGNGVRLGGKVG